MKNLAGNPECDITIREELTEAGIPFYEYNSPDKKMEVPSAIVGLMPGWTLKRAWYYWVVNAEDGVGLPFDIAEELHTNHGQECRVAGHCGCPAPREWYKQPWQLGVPSYHIDTQEALNAFAKAVWDVAGDSVDEWKEANSILQNLPE